MRVILEFDTDSAAFEDRGRLLQIAALIRSAAVKVPKILAREPGCICEAPEEADLLRDFSGNVVGTCKVEQQDG